MMRHGLCFLWLTVAACLQICFAATDRTAVVTAQRGLLLREGPSQGAGRKALIPFDAEVEILGIHKNPDTVDGITSRWLEVSYGKVKGYAFGGYIKLKSVHRSLPDGVGLFSMIEYDGASGTAVADRPCLVYHGLKLLEADKRTLPVACLVAATGDRFWEGEATTVDDLSPFTGEAVHLYQAGILKGEARFGGDVVYQVSALDGDIVSRIALSIDKGFSLPKGTYMVSSGKAAPLPMPPGVQTGLEVLVQANPAFFQNRFFRDIRLSARVAEWTFKPIGDVNGDSRMEYVMGFSHSRKSLLYDCYLCIFNLDGQTMGKVLLESRAINGESHERFVDVFDFDGDGKWEVITVGGPYFASLLNIYAFAGGRYKQVFSCHLFTTS